MAIKMGTRRSKFYFCRLNSQSFPTLYPACIFVLKTKVYAGFFVLFFDSTAAINK